MLRELSIRNFALIEDLRLELPAGFIVLTGETGAGKSILMDALGWALGDRPDETQIRGAADEAVLEAAFEPPIAPARKRGCALAAPPPPH